MRFIGDFEYHGISTILAYVRLSKNSNSTPVRFIVDTGSEVTVLGYTDARKLGIEYTSLKKHDLKIIGVAGDITPFVINNCDIILNDTDNDFRGYSTTLSQVLVLPDDDERVTNTPSLLGLDFLKYYKISFNSFSVILEL